MSNEIVPASVRLAAKRAFVRTTFQGYAATLSAGVTASVIIGLIQEFDPLTVGVTAAVAVASPPLAGLAAWLDITRKGIPNEYVEAATILPEDPDY